MNDNIREDYDGCYDDEPWTVNVNLLPTLFKAIGNKESIVLGYVLENVMYDNSFFATYKEISEATDVSVPTVMKAIRKMMKSGLLIQRGKYAWKVNPYMFYRDGECDKMTVAQ